MLTQAGAGGVQSAELQHDAFAMHALPHALKLLLQPHAWAAEQLAFAWQSPSWQQALLAIQVPLQFLVPELHTHAPPVHAAPL